MKSAIILLLFLALLGGAALSRPTQDDFKNYITTQYTQGDKNLLSAGFDQFQADAFFKSCTFNNRIVWTDVQKDGKTIYSGAFAHWFSRAEIAKDVNKAKTEADMARQAAESIKVGK